MASKAFEKSSKDVDSKAVLKKYGKEGSKKEEAFDRKQSGMTKVPPGRAIPAGMDNHKSGMQTKMKHGGMVGKNSTPIPFPGSLPSSKTGMQHK